MRKRYWMKRMVRGEAPTLFVVKKEPPLALQMSQKVNVAALLRASVCCAFTLSLAIVHVTFSH